ncbi:hypothetical protein EON64_13510, partial [archaeon]
MSESYPSKRARLDDAPNPQDYKSVIGGMLAHLPQIIHNFQQEAAKQHISMQTKDLEIEVRIGMLVQQGKRLHPRDQQRVAMSVDPLLKSRYNAEFKAGIDETLYQALKSKLTTGFSITREPVTTVYITERNERYTRTASGQGGGTYAYTPIDKKDKVFLQDFGLSSHDYDLRVTVNRELKADNTAPLPHLAYVTERRKKRISYVHKFNNLWKIDVTEVTCPSSSSSASLEVHRDIELEFELQAHV